MNPCADPVRRGRGAPEPGPADDAAPAAGAAADRRTTPRSSPTRRSRTGDWARRAATVAADQKGTSPGTYTGGYSLGQTGALGGRQRHGASRSDRSPARSPFPTRPASTSATGRSRSSSGPSVPGTGSGYVLNKGNGGYGVFFAGSDQQLHFEKVNTQATAQESGTTDQAWHHWAIVQGAGIDQRDHLQGRGQRHDHDQQHVDVRGHDVAARDRSRAGLDAVLRRPRRGRAVQQDPERDTGRGPLRRPQWRRRHRPSDPVTLDGAILRLDPDDRRGHARQPERRLDRPERPADHRLRPPQPVPVHLPAGHERAVARRRGLGHMGGDRPHRQPDGRGRQRRLAVLRGRRTAARVRRPRISASAKTSMRPGRAPWRHRTSRTTTARPSSRARPARSPAGRRSRASRSTTAATTPRATAAACSSRLHARLHLVHARTCERAPEHRPDQHLHRARDQPGVPDDRPRR